VQYKWLEMNNVFVINNYMLLFTFEQFDDICKRCSVLDHM